MNKINIIVNCINCGEEIVHTLTSMDDASVHIMYFQDAWECSECGHTTLFGDLDGIDEEDL